MTRRPTHLSRQLLDTVNTLEASAPNLDAALTRLAEAEGGGHRSTASGAHGDGGSRSSAPGSLVERLALSVGEDHAEATRRRLEAAVRRGEQAAYRLEAIWQVALGEPHLLDAETAAVLRHRVEQLIHEAHDAAVRDVGPIIDAWRAPRLGSSAKGAGVGEAGCSVMAEVGVYEEASLTNAKGNLASRVLLGTWARRFTVQHGRLPTKAEAEQRAQGRKVRTR